MKQSKAFVLRIAHKDANFRLPFERIYFFQKDDENILPRIFPNALVFAVTPQLVEYLPAITEIQTYAARRRDSTILKDWAAKYEFSKEIMKKNNFVALVPLFFYTKASAKRSIQHLYYLTNRCGKYYQTAYAFDYSPTLVRTGYILLDGNAYKPICAACSQGMNAVVGKCSFGTKSCYESLVKTSAGDFTKNIQDYTKMLENIESGDLEESYECLQDNSP